MIGASTAAGDVGITTGMTIDRKSLLGISRPPSPSASAVATFSRAARGAGTEALASPMTTAIAWAIATITQDLDIPGTTPAA